MALPSLPPIAPIELPQLDAANPFGDLLTQLAIQRTGAMNQYSTGVNQLIEQSQPTPPSFGDVFAPSLFSGMASVLTGSPAYLESNLAANRATLDEIRSAKGRALALKGQLLDKQLMAAQALGDDERALKVAEAQIKNATKLEQFRAEVTGREQTQRLTAERNREQLQSSTQIKVAEIYANSQLAAAQLRDADPYKNDPLLRTVKGGEIYQDALTSFARLRGIDPAKDKNWARKLYEDPFVANSLQALGTQILNTYQTPEGRPIMPRGVFESVAQQWRIPGALLDQIAEPIYGKLPAGPRRQTGQVTTQERQPSILSNIYKILLARTGVGSEMLPPELESVLAEEAKARYGIGRPKEKINRP